MTDIQDKIGSLKAEGIPVVEEASPPLTDADAIEMLERYWRFYGGLPGIERFLPLFDRSVQADIFAPILRAMRDIELEVADICRTNGLTLRATIQARLARIIELASQSQNHLLGGKD